MPKAKKKKLTLTRFGNLLPQNRSTQIKAEYRYAVISYNASAIMGVRMRFPYGTTNM